MMTRRQILLAYKAAQSVQPVSGDVPPNNEIWYTTSDNQPISFQYKSSGDYVEIGNKVISNTYANGKGVIVMTSDISVIRAGAFSATSSVIVAESCYRITSIVLPNSVTTIGEQAFCNCTYLASINMPSGLTSIAQAALSGCALSGDLVIPNGVTSIGGGAFSYNAGITSVTIQTTSAKVTGGTSMFGYGYAMQGGFTGNIRVPNALLSAYQADSNWNIYNLVGY